MLVRSWRRRLYGGVATAAFLPGALFAAVLALAVAGGFGKVGVLGQVFTGPPEPPGSTASALVLASRPLPSRVLAALATAPAAIGATRAAGRRVGAGAPTGSTPTAPSRHRVVGSDNSGGRHGGGSPTHGTSGGGQPPRGPSPHPTVIDGVVSVGTSATSQVPGPAGSAATQTLQSAGSTVDNILPPPPPTVP
jgi:nitrate reductase NapE component